MRETYSRDNQLTEREDRRYLEDWLSSQLMCGHPFLAMTAMIGKVIFCGTCWMTLYISITMASVYVTLGNHDR